MPIQTWEFDLDYDGPEPCPYACGNLTDDIYGGPCSACWDATFNTEPDDGLDPEEREDLRQFENQNI